MPNIASVLKQEISRIAKKEAKAFFKDLPSSFGVLKKTVSSQKKRIATLESKVAKLEKALAKDSKLALPKPEELEHSRLGASNVLKLRKKLDLTRAELGKLIGASTNSIFLWENGKATPRAAAKAKIIALRSLTKATVKKLLEGTTPKSEPAPVATSVAKPTAKRGRKPKEAKKAKTPAEAVAPAEPAVESSKS